MSATDFLPRREVDLVNWTRNFTARLVSDPVGFGVTPEMAAEYMAINDAFIEAFIAANRPGTRTRVTIREKNTAMATLRTAARRLSRVIKANDAVTATQRSILQLSLRDGGGRSPRIPRPSEPPHITVVRKRSNTITIRVWNQNGTMRSMPKGVAGARLYTFVGNTPPERIDHFVFRGTTTRTTATIDFPAQLPVGTKVWFAACWHNPRGEAGPVSTPVEAYTDYAGAVLKHVEAHSDVAEQYREAA